MPLQRALPLVWLPALCLAAACEERGQDLPDVSSAPPQLSGTYQMQGVTTVVETGDTRPIRGALILAQEGETYTATFHLETSFPGLDGDVDAEVIGKGTGLVNGDQLVGTAETQILTAMFPGVDAKFPFLPQLYGPRVVSKSVGVVGRDGSIELEIETHAAEGQRYEATRTSMRGERAAPRGVAGLPPTGAEREGEAPSS
jgi:hypothetical protein